MASLRHSPLPHVYTGQLGISLDFSGRFEESAFFGKRRAFKFTRKTYQNGLVRHGRVKIGTMSGYRAAEKEALRDEGEGSQIVKLPELLTSLNQVHPDSPFRQQFTAASPDVTFTILGAPTFQYIMPDAYLYCFSYQNSRSVLRSFMDSKPYGCVVEINDVFQLASDIVTYHPALMGWRWYCFPVVYCTRERPAAQAPAHVVESYFEKPDLFSANCEGRILFVPSDQRPPVDELPLLEICTNHQIARNFRKTTLPR